MARFDIYKRRKGSGYLLDIQTDLLSDLNTRIVVPLLPTGVAPKTASRLNPIITVNGESVVMTTQFMASIYASELKQNVGSANEQAFEISNAIDFLLVGF